MSLERVLDNVRHSQASKTCLLNETHGNTRLKDNEIPQLKKAFSSELKILHIEDLRAQDAAISLLPGLINDCQLVDFSLCGISIGDETAFALARVLQRNTSLKKLSFGGFGVGNAGLLEVAKAIKNHKSLEQFHLVFGENVSDTTLIFSAMLAAQNTNILSYNTNGFFASPFRVCQAAPGFINHFFHNTVIKRNKEMSGVNNLVDINFIYNKFATEWNKEIRQQGKNEDFSQLVKKFNWLDSEITLDDISLKLRNLPPSLKDFCLLKVNKLSTEYLQQQLEKHPLTKDLREDLGLEIESQGQTIFRHA